MRIEKLLKWFLVIAGFYMILDGLIHIFDIKLIEVSAWPQSAFIYSKFIGNLYGEFVIFVGILAMEVSRNLEKYRNLLYLAAFWSLLYSAVLLYNALTIDFVNVFSQTPSLYVWMPFYNFYLFFEGGLLLLAAVLIFIWHKKGRKN